MHTHINNFLIYFRDKAGKTSDGLYDIPRKDNLAVKISHSSSDEEESGAIYAVPRPTANSNGLDTPPATETIKTPERNGISSNHVHETEQPMNKDSSPPHQENGQVIKKKPLIPTTKRVMTKSTSDCTPPRNLHIKGTLIRIVKFHERAL